MSAEQILWSIGIGARNKTDDGKSEPEREMPGQQIFPLI